MTELLEASTNTRRCFMTSYHIHTTISTEALRSATDGLTSEDRHSRAFVLYARKVRPHHSTLRGSRVFLIPRATTSTLAQHLPKENDTVSPQHVKSNSPIMSEATPRITAPYLEQFSHQTVRILGKVRQLRGEQATIDAGGQISVFLNRVSFCNSLT